MLLGAAAAAAFAAPHPLVQRALEVTGFARQQAAGKVLHMLDSEGQELNYESAPPFLTMQTEHESWLDLASGVERVRAKMMSPGESPVDRGAMLRNGQYVFSVRGEGRDAVQIAVSPASQGRYLNAWAMLADWRDLPASSLQVGANERFLGYDRAVLVHRNGDGGEKLFFDPKTGFPVKLEVVEPHYLWGQVRVEYVYQYWIRAGEGAQVCVGSARLVDGFKEFTRTGTTVEFVDGAAGAVAAADLRWPEGGGKPMGDPTPVFLQALPVKVVEVSANTFLTVNRGYTEAFTKIGDTVYVLDATQGDARAKQDLEAVERVFGKGRKFAVVVTDTAWPHIAGLRFWVARGATVISHRESEGMLRKVVERKWTRMPDELERKRGAATAKFRFVAVDRVWTAPGGGLGLHAIDGIGSEGALMAWVPGDGFLWASDYLQTLAAPTAYADEVMAAVRRVKIRPERVAAQHLGLTAWSKVEAVAGGGGNLP